MLQLQLHLAGPVLDAFKFHLQLHELSPCDCGFMRFVILRMQFFCHCIRNEMFVNRLYIITNKIWIG